MDADKSKKLQQYAAILQEQAKDAETNGRNEDAIKHYLKLVDVFLVLASEVQDHSTWSQYIRQAEAYQTRIRSLVSQDQSGSLPAAATRAPPPPPSERQVQSTPPRPEAQSVSPDSSQASSLGSTTKAKPFSKILKPFQKADVATGDETQSTPSAAIPGSGTSTSKNTTTNTPGGYRPLLPPQAQSPPSSKIGSEDKSPVPHELYERLLSENKLLQERLQAVIKERDEKVAFLESRTRELEERIAMMVSRQDYDLLRAEFDNTVPKQEYDRIRTELANSIPLSHYDLLLDRISNMVPRDVYLAAERRALELEDNLRHSVPSDVIEDIANEVSLLNIVAEVPPIVDEGTEKKKQLHSVNSEKRSPEVESKEQEQQEEEITVRQEEKQKTPN